MTVSFVLANDATRILILAPTLQDPTAIRMRDELAVLGFDVVIQKANSTSTNLEDVAHAAGAAGAAHVERWPPEIILWVGDGQELRVSESLTGRIEPELLALRAVELLRGRLLPVPSAPRPPASLPPLEPSAVAPTNSTSAAPPPPIVSAAPSTSATIVSSAKPFASAIVPAPTPRENHFFAFVGPALLASPGGLSASTYAALSGRYAFSRLSAEAWAFLPLYPALAQNTEGEISLRTFFLGLGLDALVTSPDEPFSFSVGAGAGPMLLWFEGKSDAPRISTSGVRWAGLAYGRAGIGYRVHPRVRLRFDSLVGPVFPEPVLRIVGREVASFGRPAVFLSLGVEVKP